MHYNELAWPVLPVKPNVHPTERLVGLVSILYLNLSECSAFAARLGMQIAVGAKWHLTRAIDTYSHGAGRY